MRPLFGVGTRLALALAAIVAVALAVAWAVVVPTLERNLTQAKLDQLRNRAAVLTTECADALEGQRACFPSFLIERFASEAAPYATQAGIAANARTVVFEAATAQPSARLEVRGDSRQEASSSTDVEDDPVARRALRTGAIVEGVVTRGGGRQAEVAVPIPETNFVVLFSSSLEDTLASVEEVQQRLVVAGAVALGLAAILGYVGASAFARRLRRLERAADRIAGGDLERPVADRGRDEVGQLAKAFDRMRSRLARLEHARREFIANASHELRTPIFSLGGFLELLAGEELDERTRAEFLATMQEQVRRLEKLATDLLDLSRLDAGRLGLDVERLDLRELAEALSEEFAAVALSSGHRLEAEVDGEAEGVGDAMRTLQIGRVLVENAIRHTPPGTTVRVRAGRNGRRVALEVEDDGPGIPSEHAGQVFERFYRVEGARASGSGLGLAIAQELAGAMGGSVELDAGAGRTVFRLLLPAAGSRPREPLAARR